MMKLLGGSWGVCAGKQLNFRTTQKECGCVQLQLDWTHRSRTNHIHAKLCHYSFRSAPLPFNSSPYAKSSNFITFQRPFPRLGLFIQSQNDSSSHYLTDTRIPWVTSTDISLCYQNSIVTFMTGMPCPVSAHASAFPSFSTPTFSVMVSPT
jgi:hypothetical protein